MINFIGCFCLFWIVLMTPRLFVVVGRCVREEEPFVYTWETFVFTCSAVFLILFGLPSF